MAMGDSVEENILGLQCHFDKTMLFDRDSEW
jgi:hypothetical protein